MESNKELEKQDLNLQADATSCSDDIDDEDDDDVNDDVEVGLSLSNVLKIK